MKPASVTEVEYPIIGGKAETKHSPKINSHPAFQLLLAVSISIQ
jgi:hypothetical protein